MKMTKELKRTWILTTIVCLIPIIAGIMLYNQLPDQVVTHWDSAGNPNGWSSKLFGVIILPGILLIINILFPFLLRVDPRYSNLSEKVKCLLHWIIPVAELFGCTVTLASALGVDMKTQVYAPIFCGVLFVIIGNYLPKVSQSYTVGIKLPWTLDDEENWNKTHRFAGFLWVICGILMIISAFLQIRMISTLVFLAVMVLAPTVYSFMIYVKKQKKS